LVFSAGPFHWILHLLLVYFTGPWYLLLGNFTKYCICCGTISPALAIFAEPFHSKLPGYSTSWLGILLAQGVWENYPFWSN